MDNNTGTQERKKIVIIRHSAKPAGKRKPRPHQYAEVVMRGSPFGEDTTGWKRRKTYKKNGRKRRMQDELRKEIHKNYMYLHGRFIKYFLSSPAVTVLKVSFSRRCRTCVSFDFGGVAMEAAIESEHDDKEIRNTIDFAAASESGNRRISCKAMSFLIKKYLKGGKLLKEKRSIL